MGIINEIAKVRVWLRALVILVVVLSLVAGCGQASEQSSALEEQQRENEKLQQEIDAQQAEIDAQQEEQERAEEEAEEAEREEMQRENEELEEENERLQEENEQQAVEPQQTAEPGSEADSPDVIIESNDDWTAPPSEAYEGVVVVSPDYDVQAVTTDEAYALDAAIAYYQQVEIGDYYATHDLLSVEDQNLYPVDAWVRANTNLDSAAGEFVVTGAYPDSTVNPGYPTYAVTLTVYLPDGSSFDRTTYFTDEGNGYWAHWLSQEEMDLFDGAL